MIVSPAFNCSGEKWRTCFSTSLGPIDGLPYLDAYSNQILNLIKLIQVIKVNKSTSVVYLTTERLETYDDCVQILLFPQVDGLEKFLGRYSQSLGSHQERIDVFHTFKSQFAFANALDYARLDHIGQSVCQISSNK